MKENDFYISVVWKLDRNNVMQLCCSLDNLSLEELDIFNTQITGNIEDCYDFRIGRFTQDLSLKSRYLVNKAEDLYKSFALQKSEALFDSMLQHTLNERKALSFCNAIDTLSRYRSIADKIRASRSSVPPIPGVIAINVNDINADTRTNRIVEAIKETTAVAKEIKEKIPTSDSQPVATPPKKTPATKVVGKQRKKRESKYEPLVQSVLDALNENGEYEKLADLSTVDVAKQIQPSFPNVTIDSIARQVRETPSWKKHKDTCKVGFDRPTFQNRQRSVRRNGKPEWKDVDK